MGVSGGFVCIDDAVMVMGTWGMDDFVRDGRMEGGRGGGGFGRRSMVCKINLGRIESVLWIGSWAFL